MIKAKELKEFLEECDDKCIVYFEYTGCDFELEDGDAFRDIDLENSYMNDKFVNIVFG